MALLVGWNTGRDKVNAAEMKAFLRSPRQGKMAAVDGIKGSAKKSDVHSFQQLDNQLGFSPCIS